MSDANSVTPVSGGHSLADASVREAIDAGVIMLTASDVPYHGRHVDVDGQALLNFGSCSYLGLDQRAELREGAIRATERYGTQFSFSRAYLQSPLYVKLEEAIDRMTDGHSLVAPSTTLSHIAALPVLVAPGDAVLIDQFAHGSLQVAASTLRRVAVEPVRHNRMDLLDHRIGHLVRAHRRVWVLLDGLYSMIGDFAPMAELAKLLERYPRLHLYVDDAHSTSWLGPRGRGFALESLPDKTRVVVALSLNKAFSAGGAALIFPNQEQRDEVRRCGAPMIFSGPVPPPMLGAALASALLHLKPDFGQLQKTLVDRIHLARSLAQTLGVPLASDHVTPIFFVRCGPSKAAFALATTLRERGFYVCVSIFPAVPRNQAGIRFTVSLHNTEADIRDLIQSLADNRAWIDSGERKLRRARLSSVKPPRVVPT